MKRCSNCLCLPSILFHQKWLPFLMGYGGISVILHLFLTWAPDGSEWSASRSGCFTLLVLFKQQAGWAPGSIDMVPEKISVFFPCRNSNSGPVLHLGRRCTDWAIATLIIPSRVAEKCSLWLWPLFTSFSARRRCFSPRLDRLGFLADKVAL